MQPDRTFRNDLTTNTFDRLTRAAQIESDRAELKVKLALVGLIGGILFLGLSAVAAQLAAAGVI